MSDAILQVGELISSPTAANTAVWDRLWKHQHSDAKDDALLAREKLSRRWALIVKHVEETFRSFEGLTAVELGSGRGDLSVLLARRGVRVTLLDASDKALEQARLRFDRLGIDAEFIQGDMLAALHDVHGRFDLSLSSGVIEHFEDEDRTRVIRAHYDVLTPGGLCVISVPNAWCIPYRARKWYQELRGWWPYGFELPYKKPELVRRAKVAGFARTEARYVRFNLSLPGRSACDHPAVSGHGMLGRRKSSCLFDTFTGLVLLFFGWRSS
jgi:2-polyprenyl-3-methyl-5-hydroxy-6-metoxy-1,4-benzoquinol methylase